MSWEHKLEFTPNEHVQSQGVHYGPYNALTLLWKGEWFAAVHVKGHAQYWGQNRHYIPAHVMVFEKIREEGDAWVVEGPVREYQTGKNAVQVKAENVQWAQAADQRRRESEQTSEEVE